MELIPLNDDPTLDRVLELQRALSNARTDDDLLYEFALRFREVSGVTHVLDLDVRGLPWGDCRVMNRFDMVADEIDREELLACVRWNDELDTVPIERGEVVSRLITSEHPTRFVGIEPSDDALLDRWLPGAMDGLSIPIYFDGEIAEWLLLFRPPGLAFDSAATRLGVANMNILARHALQLKQNSEITELKGQMESDLRAIGKLQRSLLPQRLPTPAGFEMAVRYAPCELAGGDYYDFRVFGERHLGIALADVSGHGAKAAVVMAMLRTAMGAYEKLNRPAASIVEDVNAVMFDVLSDGMFVTAAFLSLNHATGSVDMLNCGHCPPLIRRSNGTVEELTGGGPPLGVLDDLGVPSVGDRLDPGDALVLYTDGITEAFNPADKLFGVDRLRATVAAAGGNADELLSAVLEAVDRHADGRERDDDQCVLVVRRCPD
ncbi:MAG: PP2C family protein-serine/threonine phosphatase [Planctomycetota bacterium]